VPYAKQVCRITTALPHDMKRNAVGSTLNKIREEIVDLHRQWIFEFRQCVLREEEEEEKHQWCIEENHHALLHRTVEPRRSTHWRRIGQNDHSQLFQCKYICIRLCPVCRHHASQCVQMRDDGVEGCKVRLRHLERFDSSEWQWHELRTDSLSSYLIFDCVNRIQIRIEDLHQVLYW
jgi:hypothetical protein